MKPVLRCFALLACVTLCSSFVILKCRCLRANQRVDERRVANITELFPRPYCNKYEVLVKLKDGSLRCLDPKSDFTKHLLRAHKENARNKERDVGSTTASARASPTASTTGESSASPDAVSKASSSVSPGASATEFPAKQN